MRSDDSVNDKIRLQVFLSRNGVCSRRKAMDLIKEGHVRISGQICREPSTPVYPNDAHISVDGKNIKGKKYQYVLMNKPAGYTTTRADRHARRTVMELLPAKFGHLSPVGRLDRDTEGLLLMTNDGDAAYQLTHPKFDVDKVYFVRILGRLGIVQQKKVEGGVFIDGRRTAPARISSVKLFKTQTELKINIHEGRKRQVRYMFAKVGHKVIYLKRLKQGPLTLGALKKGMWRLLTKNEIIELQNIL